MSSPETLYALTFMPSSLFIYPLNDEVSYPIDTVVPEKEPLITPDCVGKVYKRIAPLACKIFGNLSFDLRFFKTDSSRPLLVRLTAYHNQMEFHEINGNSKPRCFNIPLAANDGYWRVEGEMTK